MFVERSTVSNFARLLLPLGMVVMGCVSIWLNQDSNWDLRNYHLYNGYAYLNGRLGYDIAPAQVQSYFNPVLDTLVYLLTERVPPPVVGFILGAVQGVNLWLLYLIALAAMPDRRLLAFACAVVGICGAFALGELGTTFHDLTTGMFVLGGLAILSHSHSRNSLLSAGVLFGLAVGFKLTNAIYALAICLSLALTSGSWRRCLRASLTLGVPLVGAFLLIAGHWMWVLQSRFGNPVFPFFNAIFKSPYLRPENVTDSRFAIASLWDALMLPLRPALRAATGSERAWRDLRFPVVYCLALTCVVVVLARWLRTKQRPSASWLTAFTLIAFLAWLRLFAIFRYLAVIEAIIPTLIVLLLECLLPWRRAVTSVSVALFIVIVVLVLPPGFGRTPWRSRFVELTPPPVAHPGRTTVLMTSGDATSYVIPYFPPELRFVRVEGNFRREVATDKLLAEVRAAASDDRDFYVLTLAKLLHGANEPLQALSLRIRLQTCAKFKTNLADTFVLCELERIRVPVLANPG